ncbi:MAG: hypothetical protein ABIH67_04730 [Candidatus Uhrbacteria bacterium]
MGNIRFFICSNPDTLKECLEGNPSATVEAEYGNRVVEGSLLTLAHHGLRSNNPAPCLAENGCGQGVDLVGLSHFDLDTLGGCMAILGNKSEADGFWNLAAFVDVNGAHKLGQSKASVEDVVRLYAFWAWSKDHRLFAPRGGAVLDVTTEIKAAAAAIMAILNGDHDLIEAGMEFQGEETHLNSSSFVELVDGVVVRIVRNQTDFVNHLYVTPDGQVAQAVVSLNLGHGGCTISLADPVEGVSCREIVQSVWTDTDDDGNLLAGGHDGIAGSPRGQRLGLDDLVAVRDVMVKALT